MLILLDFSESLSELMSGRNLTADMLGKAIGVDGSAIRYLKRGIYKLHLANALKLADYFECSLEYLLGRTDIRLPFVPKICPQFYERLKQIMSVKKKRGYAPVKNMNFQRGRFYKWKQGVDPIVDTLVDLAAYFNCTLDYLVGRE